MYTVCVLGFAFLWTACRRTIHFLQMNIYNSDTGAYLYVGLHRYNKIHVRLDSSALFAMHALSPESYHFGHEKTKR